MYTLPEDIDNNFLKGLELESISFGVSVVVLHFNEATQISIYNKYSVAKNGFENLIEVFPVTSDNGLLELLEKKVIWIKIQNLQKDLLIHFENHTELKLLSSIEFESYEIKINDRRIIF